MATMLTSATALKQQWARSFARRRAAMMRYIQITCACANFMKFISSAMLKQRCARSFSTKGSMKCTQNDSAVNMHTIAAASAGD
eukprot:533743-Alexandrium_andersonii.AAC.1